MNLIQVVLITTLAGMVFGYCPHEKLLSTSTGNCSFRFHCIGDIRGIRLPNNCIESSNGPVKIDLSLTDAFELFDEHRFDESILNFITTLRVSGRLPKTNLSMLQHTSRLENLFLLSNKIETINGKPFFTLSSLEILDLSYNKLTHIDHLFRFEFQPNKLTKLYLGHNKIQNIAADAFSELNFLVELDLSHNMIADLTEEPFSNLTSLEVLRLNNNNITNLNGAVNYLYNLKHLYLKGNKIVNIDVESLKIIYLLQTFDMSANNLEKINNIVFLRNWNRLGSHATCKIILSGNHIKSVPNATETKEVTTRVTRHLRFSNTGDILTELDLSNNEISDIKYNAFQSLIKLTLLNLSNNKLLIFVVNPKDVTFVKYLNLSGNKISVLNFDSFSGMHSLQNLDLSNNELSFIHDQAFSNNYNLRHVNLTNNNIERLDNLHINMFHFDGELDLSNNGLSHLHVPKGEGLRLTYLILHSNNITDPYSVDLRQQTDLNKLDMSRNQIHELLEDSLRLPVSLTYLDLSYNQIKNIAPSTFFRIWHLKTLILAHNQLKTIEYGSFHGLSSLLFLDLSYNKISFLDSKLLMDLKSLVILSLTNNGLKNIVDNGWYGHGHDLKVILDGNNFTCEWLAVALKNHDNGFSKMRPTVIGRTMSGHSLEGIPCTADSQSMSANLRDQSSLAMADERLLLTSQKILEAIRDQTYYLKKYIWRSIQEESEKMKIYS